MPPRSAMDLTANEMIRVIVTEENLPESEANAPAHHLALGPLATVEQDRLPLPVHRDSRGVPVDGGAGSGGSQKGQGQHANKIKAIRRFRRFRSTCLQLQV